MRRLLLRAGLTIAVALMFAAPAAAAAKPTGPCAVVTRADATKVLGATSRPGLIQKFGPHVRCTYTTSTYRSLSVEVEVVSQSEIEKEAKADPKPIARIYGVGDEAYSTAGGASLVFWKNGAQVTLVIFATGLKTSIISAEQSVGKIAASRL
jgi:hypothetical protein